MFAARLAAVALSVGLAAGSPMICFPIDIGDAASLPYARDGFRDKAELKPDEVATTLRAVLGKSDEAMVHMETLRRTVAWLMALGGQARGPNDPSRVEAAKIQALLTDELLVAAAADGATAVATAGRPSGPARAQALRWFDLGYFLAAGSEAGVCEAGRARDFLEKATRLAPDDLSIRFGVALGEFDRGADRSGPAWASQLAHLFDDKAAPANLKKNVLATFGAFLGQDDWDKLGAEVRKHVGRV